MFCEKKCTRLVQDRTRLLCGFWKLGSCAHKARTCTKQTKSLVQGSCAHKASTKNCLSCAYKTLVQDPEPLIVPVCTFLLALRIYFWALLSQPRRTLSLQSPYKTRTRRRTRLRTRLWGAHPIFGNRLLALSGGAGYALYYLCWRCRAINPTPSHPPSNNKKE